MSQRYYYILKCQLRKLAAKNEKKNDEMCSVIGDYVDSIFTDQGHKVPDNNGVRMWGRGELAAIPATDPLPPNFKYLKHDKEWMLPKATKKGREIDKKWKEMAFENTGKELRDILGLESMQFLSSGVLVWPKTILLRPTAKKKVYILSSGKSVNHKDAVEIPLGQFDDLRTKSNKRAQKVREK